jgi:hypothetical protein
MAIPGGSGSAGLPGRITVPRRRRKRPLLRLAILAAIGWAIYGSGAWDDIRRGAQEIRDSIEATNPQQPSVTGLRPGSFVRQDEFAAALAQLRSRGSRLVSMDLHPGVINVLLLTRDGRERVLEVTPGPKVATVATRDSQNGAPPSVRLARVDPAAPSRLTDAAAGRHGISTDDVELVAFTFLGPDPHWIVYFKGDRRATGDLHGKLEELR